MIVTMLLGRLRQTQVASPFFYDPVAKSRDVLNACEGLIRDVH